MGAADESTAPYSWAEDTLTDGILTTKAYDTKTYLTDSIKIMERRFSPMERTTL